ncbi:AbgT family transporter [Oceanobacillus locisalsi]|uniref:AbgT family transporter n=1 Tax=Oceanobacillus locisalsi TaxID=546107 RepID=A0ABW3NN36_9BACI
MKSSKVNKNKRLKGKFDILSKIEGFGNKLPEPYMLFVFFIIILMIVSVILSIFEITVLDPKTSEELEIRSLWSSEGIEFMVTSLVTNFTAFAPLGVVLSVRIGIGIAEGVGLLEAGIKKIMLSFPAAILPYMTIFTGNLATVAADSAYLILPPLAGMIYYSLGRNPIAGIITAFVGIASGIGTGVLIQGNEAILASLTNEASALISDNAPAVTPVDNYYFMVAGAVVATLVGGFISQRITEPRLGPYNENINYEVNPVTKDETIALKWAMYAGIIYLTLVVIAISLPGSPLRNAEGGLVPSPFLDGILTFIIGLFLVIGVTYGIKMKRIRNTRDAGRYMGEAIYNMRNFLVLILFISQFIAYFEWTRVGTWFAVNGAEFLTSVDFTGFSVIIGLIFVTTIVNFVITSGAAQWAIFSPIFVPMLLQLGYHPAYVQMAYRIGDASTSMMSPLNPYIVMILEFMRKWDKNAGLGTIISHAIPYVICLLISLTLLFSLFTWLGIPIGPGVTTNVDVQ